ncbi:MAG: C25 family peptidase propeptide domain-containing protein, partial [Chloroflexota bacterium]
MVKPFFDRSHFAPLTLAIVIIVMFALLVAGHSELRAARAGAEMVEPAQKQTGADTQIMTSDEQRLHFVLDVPDVMVADDGAVSVPGLQTGSATPGAPALPAYSTFVILPPGAEATVEVVANESQVHDVAYVRPAPQPAEQMLPEDVSALHALPNEPLYEPAPEFYKANADYPGILYELSEPAYYRDLRVVQLHLYPLQYNAVKGVLQQFSRMEATITFSGANFEGAAPAAGNADYLQALAPLAINYEQAHKWRGLPTNLDTSGTMLPTGQDTFKISVNEDGIYEITCRQLAEAGMDIDNSDPHTFEMLYRDQPVAFEFLGDEDDQCAPDESIRFYGWAFDGSRLERQFLTENVFWLWAGGTPTEIMTRTTESALPQATSFRESLTREPERIFTHVWTDQWENSPNEPDTWAWQRVEKAVEHWPTLEFVHEISATAPFQAGTSAVVTVEILSHTRRPDHDVGIYFNGDQAISGDHQWANPRSVNVTMTVPMTAVVDGPNDVHVVYRTPVTNTTSTDAIT